MTALHKHSKLVAGMVLAVFAAAASCRASTPVATAPGAGAASGAAQDMANRLNSSNLAERDAAQKQAAMYYDLLMQPEALQKFLESAPDYDVKDLLRERVAKLKGRAAAQRFVSPPPISLNVKDASLQEVVDSLNKSLNIPLIFESATDAGFVNRFTLTAVNKPFWEIFVALHQQHPLMLGPNGPNPGLRISGGRPSPAAVAIDGPALAFIGIISLQRTAARDPGGPAPKSNLTFTSAVAFDPRLDVVRLQPPTIVKAVDERGQVYPSPAAGPGEPPLVNYSAALTHLLGLGAPAELGKKLSFTMETAAEVNVVSDMTTIDDLEHNLNKLVALGNRSYRVSRFDSAATTVVRGGTSVMAPARLTATIVAGDASQPTAPVATPARPATPGRSATNNSMQFMIVDATGTPCWRGAGVNSGSFTASFSATTPPYKLEIRTFSGTATLPVHLQFKDVPLP